MQIGYVDQKYLCVSIHIRPHYLLHAKPEDIAKYKGKYTAGWDILRQKRLARQKELGLVDERWEVVDRDELAQAWEQAKTIDENWQQLRMEVYAAMIDSVDQNIGRLLNCRYPRRSEHRKRACNPTRSS
jgi:arylsulfatase A-like enzyme